MSKFWLTAFCLPLPLMGQLWDVEARVAFFSPSNQTIRKIYDNGWAQYQLQASGNVWEGLGIFVSGAYSQKRGHSIGLHKKTELRNIPVTFGAKYTVELPYNLEGYVGGGALVSFVRFHDHSKKLGTFQHISGQTWGGVVKTALQYRFRPWVVAGAFIDYNYNYFQFSGGTRCVRRVNVDLSGFLFGGSIGVNF